LQPAAAVCRCRCGFQYHNYVSCSGTIINLRRFGATIFTIYYPLAGNLIVYHQSTGFSAKKKSWANSFVSQR